MANMKRGEVALELGGERYALCLTLGALADLEDAFGVVDLPALAERLASGRLSSRDLLKILAVTLRGGGHALTDAQVAALPIDSLDVLAAAIGDVFAATFGDAPENPPPQGA